MASGASLVLFLAVVFLLLICIHLSWEASRLEDETRALAEEVALIRAELRDVKEQQAGFRAQLEGEQAAANGRPVGHLFLAVPAGLSPQEMRVPLCIA